MKRIHFIQHVEYEGLGAISGMLSARGCEAVCTELYRGDKLPELSSFDSLIVMGGPMGVYESNLHSWIEGEIRFIAEAAAADKKVFGVCLGAQLIANALGARVFPGNQKEIGWFPIWKTEAGKKNSLFAGCPDKFPVLHWHGDTFDLPHGAERLFSSEAYPNQAFSFGSNVLALQFHLELQADGLDELNCARADISGRFIQSEAEIAAAKQNFTDSRSRLEPIVDWLTA